MSLCDACNHDWVREALKKVHSVAVRVHIILVFPTEHVQLDSVPSQVFDQEGVSIIEGNLMTKDADESQVSGQFE